MTKNDFSQILKNLQINSYFGGTKISSMNYSYLFIALIITANSITASAQDVLPNGGFEDWTPNPNYEKPADWNTLNALTYLLNKITAFKTTDPAEVRTGNYAIKLVSKFITTTDFGPAVVTTGSISPQGISGGIPINSRPSALTGWYMYSPVGNDNALFEISLLKQGNEIGSGVHRPGDAVSEWTIFSVPINYTSAETPDIIRISLFASEGGDSPPAMENSTLYLDDLAYDYSTSVENIYREKSLTIFPNPAFDFITVEINDIKTERLVIHSLDGKKAKEIAATTGSMKIKMNDLHPGKYILSAISAQGVIQSGFFEIQR